MKIRYGIRIYIYLLVFFIFFSGLILIFIAERGKELKTGIIESEPVIYTKIIHNYIVKNQLQSENWGDLADFTASFPENLHFSILDENGFILFDNKLFPNDTEKDQKQKTEIKRTLLSGKGWSRRKSPKGTTFLYYAEHKGDYFIRVGIPYTSGAVAFIKPDGWFMGLIISLFIVEFILISVLYRKSRQSLKNFKLYVSYLYDRIFPTNFTFVDDELSDIQVLMEEIYHHARLDEENILLEREKLLEHFHFAEEGISFFTPFFDNIYTNSHFIQYLNILLNKPTFDVKNLFESPVFTEVVRFLENPGKKNTLSSKLHANGYHFFVHVIRFDDESFEIIIRDTSEIEKNSLDRAEMTNNIAHELRTPVTSVRGYLETLIEHDSLSPEKKKEFLQRAYKQIIRLSEIIQDVILLSKSTHAPQYFTIENVNIREMIQMLIEEELKEFTEKNDNCIELNVPGNVIVKGNHTLLYSIFWNLSTNALKYAGENITIFIHNYMEDDDYYYFSFADNGKGIDEKYLDRIFERFYRITEGRTRDRGGSGLGLPIVKDAVNFHNGEILVKNRSEGGLEFLFTLRKK
jgi:two-component system OmpR family sensor kinase/two-component system phosphate regulon sensor histidine kinase PhoR